MRPVPRIVQRTRPGTGGRGSDGRFTGVNTHLPIATSTTLTMTRANGRADRAEYQHPGRALPLHDGTFEPTRSDGVRQFALSASRFSMRVLYPGQETSVEGGFKLLPARDH